jgi:ABC-2 type transport system permease protein
VLPGQGFTAAAGYPPLSLADEPTRRAFLGTVLYFGLIALLGVGLGAILRHTGGTITAALVLLYMVPIIASAVTAKHWHDWLTRLSPMSAGLVVQVTKRLATQPIGPWAGLGVLAGYAAAAVLLGGVLLHRRNA